MTIINLIGWFGAVVYIVAFFLLTIHVISSSSFLYNFLNILGAIGLIINAYYLRDSPNIIVNLAWLLIATIGINNLYRKKSRQKP
ncbi:CBU_0592 family membrane protein [Pedobacter nutrimenti]|uniref:CBU_0592 family membrane protein n=1 Tax=Pedobacter nutrimenti TaxID=1241337 RepID=UPI00397768C0